MKLFILAGEPSGDRLGADLVARLKPRDTKLQVTGVGGAELEDQGLRSLFPMKELSVMGWRDILPRLPWLHLRAFQVARAIVRDRPDVVVLVDAQIFSSVVAGHVRRMGSRVPILLYVAPAVWAWAPQRAAKLHGKFNEVLAVLPFEPRVMRSLGGPPTSYVGHPATDKIPARARPPERGPLLLLPGSRDGELRRLLPLMRRVAEQFAAHPRVTGVQVLTLGFLAERLARETADWSVPVEIVAGGADRNEALSTALAACTSMGTATLELALAGVPMVGTYVADKGQEKRWYKYEVKYASLPNVILQAAVVPEVLFVEPAAPERLMDAVGALLAGDGVDEQLAGFAKIRETMEQGVEGTPITDPSDRVLSYFSAR